MPTVEVNGHRAAYEVDDFTDPWGPAELPIVVQHGTMRSAAFWRHWVPRLGRTRPVIRRDLIGHGESEIPPPDYEWSIEVLADDVAGFLDALEIPEAHFLGDSFGGIVGATFASRHPERVRTLTLSSTPPRSPEAESLKGDGEWVVRKMEELGSAGWAQMLLDNGVLQATSPEQAVWVVEEAGRTPTHVVAGLLEMLSPSDGSEPVSIMPLLQGLSMPVLFIAPPRGPVVSLAEQVAMRDATPDAEIAVIPAPGHEIYVSGADRSIDALLDFLARRGGGRSN